MFLAAPKMVSFLQLAAEKKDTIFGAARKFFGPSYFVTALATTHMYIQGVQGCGASRKTPYTMKVYINE